MKVPRRFTNFLKIKNEHLWIVAVSIVILGGVLLTQFTFGDSHPDSFLTSLLPNFFADVISVLVTTYLLAYLLQKNQDKKEKQLLYEVIKKDYIAFVHKIARNYLFLITKKEEFIHSGEANGLLEMRIGIDSIKENRELIDASTMLKRQGELKEILYGKWGSSFMKFNPAFQTYIEEYENLRMKEDDIILKYVNEDLIADFDNMSESDKKLLKQIEDAREGLESEYKFPFITARFMSYYYNYTVEVIGDFTDSHESILPIDMKMAIFRLQKNLDDTVEYAMKFSADPQLSQEKKERMQKTMSNITKEISFLLDYFKDYEDVS